MNYNYEGSVAQRFMQFTSGVQATEDTSTDLFNAISVYVPHNLAAANIIDYVADGIATEAVPVIKTVTVDNYREVLQGALLRQYEVIFNSDTNLDVILYVVVFYTPDGSGADVFADYLTVTDYAIDFSPLTTAFNLLYHISFFKTIFSEHYDGTVVVGNGAYDDSNYFDLVLALSYLCIAKKELSYNLAAIHVSFPLATPDTNPCLIASKTRGN